MSKWRYKTGASVRAVKKKDLPHRMEARCGAKQAGRTAAGLSSEIELKVPRQQEDGQRGRVDATKTPILVQNCRGVLNSIQHWETVLCPRCILLKRRKHIL
jgi:hypothetical protein